MAVSRHGYAGAVEVEGGRVNIAAAIDPAFLKAGAAPADAVDAILAGRRRASRPRPSDASTGLGTLRSPGGCARSRPRAASS